MTSRLTTIREMDVMDDNKPIPKKKKFRPKKRKNKLVLVFDENARREFLTGFRKRKLQRKNKAKEELEKQLKSERKRIQAQAKEQYKKILLSQKAIPQLEDLMSEEIDMGTHSVSVTELSTADLAKKNNWIGINEVQYEGVNNKEEKSDDSNDEYQSNHELEGMEMKKKRKHGNDIPTAARNCKDIKRAIMHQATLNVKNSKIFQQKVKIEKMKNIKLHKKNVRKQEKTRQKDKRLKHKKKR